MKKMTPALVLKGLALGLVVIGMFACTDKPVATADPALPELLGSLEIGRAHV